MFVSYSLHVSIVGFFTLRQKRIRGGSTFALKGNVATTPAAAANDVPLSQCHVWVGPTQYPVQLANPVYIELDGGRHACRQRGGMEGASENGWLEGGSGGMEGGSDDVRHGGSGSGGSNGGLREEWLIRERARKGRNEAWTERGKERREKASGGTRKWEGREQPSEGEEQERSEGRREQGRERNFNKGGTLRRTLLEAVVNYK